MSENTKNSFVAYERKEITTKRGMEDIYIDGYQNFGWKQVGRDVFISGLTSVNLRFKRDRKITNREELIGGNPISIWNDKDGMYIANGDTARFNYERHLTWEEVADYTQLLVESRQ